MTKANEIVSAIFDTLTNPDGLFNGPIWRSRLRPIPENQNLAIVVRRGDDVRIEATTIGNYQRQLTVTIEIYARGDVPDELADTLIEKVMERVMEDTTIGGLSDNIEAGNILPEWQARDTDLVMLDMDLLVTYETQDAVL